MFLKYLYDVLIPSSPPFLIRVSFDLKDIFNITINIKNVIRLYYFILLWGCICREAFVLRGGVCPGGGGGGGAFVRNLCPGGFCPVPAIAI